MEEPGRLQSMGSLELDITERLHFHFSLSCIGEGNGNPLQCSCLENPRDRKPGGLPSMGSHRVGHDWSDVAAAAADCSVIITYAGFIFELMYPHAYGTFQIGGVVQWDFACRDLLEGKPTEAEALPRNQRYWLCSSFLPHWDLRPQSIVAIKRRPTSQVSGGLTCSYNLILSNPLLSALENGSILFVISFWCLIRVNEVVCISVFCHVWLFVTPWTAAHQAPLSMEFSRQETWSGLPFSTPEDFSNPGIKPTSPESPALAGEFFTSEPPGKARYRNINSHIGNFWLIDR